MARVLLVSVVYEPDIVSTASIVAGLARGLQTLGHEVSVLSSIPHYNPDSATRADRKYRTGWLRPYRYSVEAGVQVARCYIPQRRQSTLSRISGFSVLHITAALAALRLFRRTQVVIVVSPPLTLAFLGFVLKVISGTRIIYNAQELWPDVPRDLGVITSRGLLAALGAIERIIYARSDAITPIGEQFGEIIRLRGAPHGNVVVIPNFVDTAWIAPRPKVNPLSEEWHLTGRPVALYAGNFGLTQDFEMLIAVAKRMPHVDFVFVGAGAGASALTRLHHDRALPNVQVHPYVPKDRVADLYGLADVVLVPLRPGHDRTTTPSKIFSAMAAGKPVLACARADTDLADVLRRSAAGLAVPPGDVEAFAGGLEALLDRDQTEHWDLSTALETAGHHSADAAASEYDELIRRLLASPRPALL